MFYHEYQATRTFLKEDTWCRHGFRQWVNQLRSCCKRKCSLLNGICGWTKENWGLLKNLYWVIKLAYTSLWQRRDKETVMYIYAYPSACTYTSCTHMLTCAHSYAYNRTLFIHKELDSCLQENACSWRILLSKIMQHKKDQHLMFAFICSC